MAMAMNESEATRILRDMARDREETWGFFFYRACYYDDETRWESFLERMKKFAELTLLKPRSYNKDGGGQVLLNKLERHRELMRFLYGEYDATVVKHGYPIIVDKDSLDSVLEAPGPTEWRSVHTSESTAHVTVLDMQWFDLREASEEDEYLPEDEVGWTNVLAVKACERRKKKKREHRKAVKKNKTRLSVSTVLRSDNSEDAIIDWAYLYPFSQPVC
ncbi:hypothetical protein PENDEC_c008G01220 [Penicillium decumbens]|uniref:Uncharacterized protein n=1 Tax=Penicillium decumbens TaxID=69771 RepID=A0A1V6PE29_PENDC|nr:hypothetical protein PENDEC_c008G01220 [Penicillium decumbens]